MKRYALFLWLCYVTGIALISCRNESNDAVIPDQRTTAGARSGSSGSGSGNGGGGKPTSNGFLQGVLSGLASRHVSGGNDSVLVTFTQQTPAGWVLSMSSSNPAVQVPSTFAVPAGVLGVYVPFRSTVVPNSINVTISATLFSQTKSTTIKVFPRTATFPAPILQSPSNGAGFKDRTIINFTSNTNNNAFYYHLQISNNSSFSPSNLDTELLLDDPLWRQSTFSSFGTHYWRMRFVDGSGNGGPWSAVRTFEIKQR